MKTLTLLRHAKSGDDGLVTRDFDRRLNAKGRRAARSMGRHLREQDFRFEGVVASTALRVVETIEEVAIGYGHALAPTWDRRIYLATAAELIDLIQMTPDTIERLLLAGHNPGLEDIVLTLVPDGPDGGGRSEVAEKYPTASVAEIQLDIASWKDIEAGCGRMLRFIRPRDIDPALGPDAD